MLEELQETACSDEPDADDSGVRRLIREEREERVRDAGRDEGVGERVIPEAITEKRAFWPGNLFRRGRFVNEVFDARVVWDEQPLRQVWSFIHDSVEPGENYKLFSCEVRTEEGGSEEDAMTRNFPNRNL